MGKDYRGVGYLTGRRLSFNSGDPRQSARVEDDSLITTQKSQRRTANAA